MKFFVHVAANARKNEVAQIDETHFKIWCAATPEHGKANAVVIKMLARFLKIPKTTITLIFGATSRDKIFEI